MRQKTYDPSPATGGKRIAVFYSGDNNWNTSCDLDTWGRCRYCMQVPQTSAPPQCPVRMAKKQEATK